MPAPATRRLTVVAQDPAVRRGGRIVTAEVEIPNEALSDGPRGYRVQVVDYDPASGALFIGLPAHRYGTSDKPEDPFSKASNKTMLGDPKFHAQNVYATVMRTLGRFETALGRRIPWGFGSHQLNVAPHGIAGANAFYSRQDQALVFGYFDDSRSRTPVFTCLSHDIIVHETTHALLDGLRPRFMDPSSPDQAAFHEGYADVISLLSGFSMPEVIRAALQSSASQGSIPMEKLTVEAVKSSILTGLAEQMGSTLSGVRGAPLRRSVLLAPSRSLYTDPTFQEEHKRGELLVAAVMHAFLRIWESRMATLGSKLAGGRTAKGGIDTTRVIEEAAAIAGRLLKIMIRAIDYTPPIHLRFGDFLSAALTADYELVPVDREFAFRDHLRNGFEAFGVLPASERTVPERGLWDPPKDESALDYQRTRFESLQRDENEVFRFLWENRKVLDISLDAYTQVLSVRPCRRIGPDGFILHETVAEYLQIMRLRRDQLADYGIPRSKANDEPDSAVATADDTYKMYGGGTLIFDEFGRLKFHITNRVHDKELQRKRMPMLWASEGYDEVAGVARRSFQALHLRRMASWPLGLDHLPAIRKGRQ